MDAQVYENALLDGFDIPEGKYYLADVSFPSCKQLLIPYCVIWYRLAKWGHAKTRCICQSISIDGHLYVDYRPRNKKELFDLHYTSAYNVIEHILGVLKWHFWILLLAPEYSLQIQARISAALCAIHNFICIHDPAEEVVLTGNDHDNNAPLDHDHVASATTATEVDRPSARWDHIAWEMWADYLSIHQERGISDDEDELGNNSDEELDD